MSAVSDAFEGLMRLYGRPSPDFVAFEEGPPVLASRFKADEAAAAALTAGATVAADLWRFRTGQGQAVRVSTREAAASLTSFTYQRFADPERAPPTREGVAAMQKTAAMGFKPTGDGRHVFLHPSFPPGTRRILDALASQGVQDAARAASWTPWLARTRPRP